MCLAPASSAVPGGLRAFTAAAFVISLLLPMPFPGMLLGLKRALQGVLLHRRLWGRREPCFRPAVLRAEGAPSPRLVPVPVRAVSPRQLALPWPLLPRRAVSVSTSARDRAAPPRPPTAPDGPRRPPTEGHISSGPPRTLRAHVPKSRFSSSFWVLSLICVEYLEESGLTENKWIDTENN